jgi:hypothetical protein
MPRRKQEAEEQSKISKAKAKPRRIAVHRKVAPKVNELEIARIKELLQEEEQVIEADLRKEFKAMLSERDQVFSRQTEMDAKNKRLIIWIGVTLFMLSIVSFWVSNLDVMIRPKNVAPGERIDAATLQEAKENIGTNLDQVMKEIDRLKTEAKKLEAENAARSSSTPEEKPVVKFK